jgi:undecaprenyl-diphosphatase
VLGVIDRLASGRRDEYAVGPGAALAIGIGQAVALIPGVSRSGATIGVGLLAGLNRAAAARFSFLLSTPIIAGAVAKQSVDVARAGISPSDAPVYLVGILASAITGYAIIRFFLRYLRTNSLMPFVIYRVVLGAIVIALAVNGRLPS